MLVLFSLVIGCIVVAVCSCYGCGEEEVRGTVGVLTERLNRSYKGDDHHRCGGGVGLNRSTRRWWL